MSYGPFQIRESMMCFSSSFSLSCTAGCGEHWEMLSCNPLFSSFPPLSLLSSPLPPLSPSSLVSLEADTVHCFMLVPQPH